MVTSTGGTAAGRFGQHDVAGKTGTAQTFYYGANRSWWGNSTYNLTFEDIILLLIQRWRLVS